MSPVKHASRVPRRSRPVIRGYGIPDHDDGMLAWNDVSDRIAQARTYWIGTVDQHDQPHAVPIWGIWVDATLFFDGAPHVRWVRNLETNPKAVVHLESGTEVVILEGLVIRLPQLDAAALPRVAAASEAKYGGKFEDHGCLALHPDVVYAWTSFPADATRFHFDARQTDRHYVATLVPAESGAEGENAWDVLDTLAGTVEAPEDWSAERKEGSMRTDEGTGTAV